VGFDGKYGQVTTERKIIPADEPVIVLRAQDRLATHAIGAYLKLAREAGCGDDHITAILTTQERFETWQATHQDQVKLVPDTDLNEFT